MSYALIADLGGTNARFAITLIGQHDLQQLRVLPCSNYDSLFNAIDEYIAISHLEIDKILAVVLAVAAPVNQPVIRFSNNHWEFTYSDLLDYFGVDKNVALLNDFDAIGYSLDVLKESEKVAVKANKIPDNHAPSWVIGPGTGLGVACVIPQGEKINLLLPGEGGHVDLPSTTEQEDYILHYLRERHHRVSAERVLSGMGIENIYAALAHKQGEVRYLTAPEIGEAFVKGDTLALACMEQFFVYLGRVIGNLILNVESRGGVFIAGGIVPRYAQALLQSGFSDALEDKGRMSELVSAIPIYIVTAEYPGLLGCANYATYLVKQA